jgi:hypothetical protein
MAAKKRAERNRANKKRPASRGNGVTPTLAQKRSMKQSLGAIRNDAKNIELRIDQVLRKLSEVDFGDFGDM